MLVHHLYFPVFIKHGIFVNLTEISTEDDEKQEPFCHITTC